MEIAKLVLEFMRALIWPVVIFFLSYTFSNEIRALIGRITKAALPGGVGIDFSNEIKDAKELSQKVENAPLSDTQAKGLPPIASIPLTEGNARMISLGLQPSPSGLNLEYYRGLASQDPALSLVALRIEVDILARNLARGFKIEIDQRESGSRLLRRLKDNGAIDSNQFDLVMTVLRLCNAAAHGEPVTRGQADDIIDIVGRLMDQYIKWLSWGFSDEWKPTKQAANS